MAVYQGARQPLVTLPRGTRRDASAAPARPVAGAPARPRRRVGTAARAGTRPSRAALGIGAIVVLFAGAFFSLAQDVRVSASGYDVARLSAEQDRLRARAEDLRNELNRLGQAPAVRRLATEAGLGPLPVPVVLPAR